MESTNHVFKKFLMYVMGGGGISSGDQRLVHNLVNFLHYFTSLVLRDCPLPTGLCCDASLEVFYVNYLSEVFYVENR